VKKALDQEWSDPDAKARAVDVLARQVESLEAWLRRKLPDEMAKPPLKEHVDTLVQIRTQDLEPDPASLLHAPAQREGLALLEEQAPAPFALVEHELLVDHEVPEAPGALRAAHRRRHERERRSALRRIPAHREEPPRRLEPEPHAPAPVAGVAVGLCGQDARAARALHGLLGRHGARGYLRHGLHAGGMKH
jgi:hypothetical protein